MKQSGFSSVLLLVIVVVLGSIGAAGFMMMKDSGVIESIESSSDDTAATTSAAKSSSQEKSNDGKTTSKTKSKVDVCDILTMEKASSITGVPMRPISDVNGIPQVPYEDEDVWSSTCAYYDPANVESSEGVSVMLMEALSSEAKAEIMTEWDRIKAESGGVDISGFGDKAFKIITTDDFYAVNFYYVMVGNTMIMASSGLGNSGYDEYGRMAILSVEETDAVTEETLRYVLSQLK